MDASATIGSMAKQSTSGRGGAQKKKPPTRTPAWVLYCRVDPELEKAVGEFISQQELKPSLARVVERALKLYLESKNCWPPKS